MMMMMMVMMMVMMSLKLEQNAYDEDLIPNFMLMPVREAVKNVLADFVY